LLFVLTKQSLALHKCGMGQTLYHQLSFVTQTRHSTRKRELFHPTDLLPFHIQKPLSFSLFQ
jgi:hypothetical protein